MKKIVLKTESCIGCGACVGIDAEHFEFSDDGYSMIKSQDNLDSTALSDAIDACPVAIISLEECNDTGADVGSQNENVDDSMCECNPCECENCHCHEDEKNAA